jgi:hypothetical protein
MATPPCAPIRESPAGDKGERSAAFSWRNLTEGALRGSASRHPAATCGSTRPAGRRQKVNRPSAAFSVQC